MVDWRKKIVLVSFSLIIVCSILFFSIKTEEKIIYPRNARDTDGTLEDEIIKNNLNGYEKVILKFYPFGFIEFWGWDDVKFVRKAVAYFEWKAEKDFGAGNIYLGYSFDGKNYKEIGPFDGSDNFVTTAIEIPIGFFGNLKNLRIRFRGEDLDFAVDAVAEVKVYLKVISYKFGV